MPASEIHSLPSLDLFPIDISPVLARSATATTAISVAIGLASREADVLQLFVVEFQKGQPVAALPHDPAHPSKRRAQTCKVDWRRDGRRHGIAAPLRNKLQFGDQGVLVLVAW